MADSITFDIGDYRYSVTDFLNQEVQAKVIDNTKSSYEPIPATVTYENITYSVIDISYCFADCDSLISLEWLVIPNSVTNMTNCFGGCDGLTSLEGLVIPNSVTKMSHCFYNCDGLTSLEGLVIPNSVTDMSYCFDNCSNLTSLNGLIIPDSVTNMDYCFRSCINLISSNGLAISSSVTRMNSCFRGCTNLIAAPTIPDSVTNINYCFYGCTNLTGDIFVFNNPTTYNYTFTSTVQPITIKTVNTTILSTWQTIANSYTNVTAVYDPSLSHIGDKINLKVLLTKILQQLKTLSNNLAIFKSAEEKAQQSSNQTAYQTWKYVSNFGNNLTGTTSDENYLTVGQDGMRCHKSGYYLLNASGHCNCTGGTSIAVRWYNATTGVTIGDSRYFYDKSLTWMPFYVTSYGYVNENDVVAFQMQKYNPNNTTNYFKPSSLMVSYIYLGDEGVGKRENVGFSLTASTINVTDKFGMCFHIQSTSSSLTVSCLNNTNIKITSASHSAYPNMTFTYTPGTKEELAYAVGTETVRSIAGTLTLTYEPK